jgi:hypothetical protein
MPSLLDLCHEVLHDVVSEVQPADLAVLSKSCRALNGYIKGNRLLWRDVFLKHFVSLIFSLIFSTVLLLDALRYSSALPLLRSTATTAL